MREVQEKVRMFGLNINASFTVFDSVDEAVSFILKNDLQDKVIINGRMAAIMQGIIPKVNPKGEQLTVNANNIDHIDAVTITGLDTDIDYDIISGLKVVTKIELLEMVLDEYYTIVFFKQEPEDQKKVIDKLKNAYANKWKEYQFTGFGLIVQVIEYFEKNANINKIKVTLTPERLVALDSCQSIMKKRG